MGRAFRLTAIASVLAWIALVTWAGYFRFDDFWSIHHSRGAHLFSNAAWHGLTADGRWQPLMSTMFDAGTRLLGTSRAWPWYLAVALAHALTAILSFAIARSIWSDRDTSADAFAMAFASLNFSAFSLGTIATLHGVMSTASATASAFFAVAMVRAPRGNTALLGLGSAASALAACLFKESGVTSPALALLCGALMTTDVGTSGTARALRIALPPIAGVTAYLGLRAVIGIPLSPDKTRYVLSLGPHVIVNAAIVAAFGLLWLAPAAAGLMTRAGRSLRRDIYPAAAITIAWMLIACAPALFLKWRSPGFWHLLAPGVAIGAAALVRQARHAGVSRVSYAALMAVTLVLFVSVTAAFVRSGGLQWGRLTQSAVEDWMRLRRPGDGRVIWIDRDQLARYGGLARIIGPGHRLSYALSMVTNEYVDARVCAALPVGPIYEPRDNDAVFEHSGGRLTRVPLPTERFYCLP